MEALKADSYFKAMISGFHDQCSNPLSHKATQQAGNKSTYRHCNCVVHVQYSTSKKQVNTATLPYPLFTLCTLHHPMLASLLLPFRYAAYRAGVYRLTLRASSFSLRLRVTMSWCSSRMGGIRSSQRNVSVLSFISE